MSERVEVVKAANRFEIEVNGTLAGFAEYSNLHGVRSFPHTEVDPGFQGRGLASTLIRQALDMTRAEELGVLPFCPAVKRYINRHPEYADLVPQDRRAQFGL